MYVTLSAGLMALTLVTASAMMAEFGPVPLGQRQAVEGLHQGGGKGKGKGKGGKGKGRGGKGGRGGRGKK